MTSFFLSSYNQHSQHPHIYIHAIPTGHTCLTTWSSLWKISLACPFASSSRPLVPSLVAYHPFKYSGSVRSHGQSTARSLWRRTQAYTSGLRKSEPGSIAFQRPFPRRTHQANHRAQARCRSNGQHQPQGRPTRNSYRQY